MLNFDKSIEFLDALCGVLSDISDHDAFQEGEEISSEEEDGTCYGSWNEVGAVKKPFQKINFTGKSGFY